MKAMGHINQTAWPAFQAMLKVCMTIAFIFSGTALWSATLFSNGKTTYTIVVARGASESEKTAAKELQTYLKQIGGATLAITNQATNTTNHIFVGYSPTLSRLTGLSRPEKEDESFIYKSFGNDIVIMGGSQRGTLYGVYSFLENEMGVRWYRADYTKVPQKKAWTFKSLDHAEKPFIPYRYTMYHMCADDKHWAAHNKNNFHWTARKNEYGGMEACHGAHTMHWLLPKELFSSHPEYFGLRNGKRDPEAQRCLSNKNVLQIIRKNLLDEIGKNPGYLYYDVSQLDNYLYCECKECKKIEARYGNQHSGIIVWFVNQLADAVAKQYPGKKLCTLAYLYSRHAPKNIKPRENVVIRLCDFECCFAHPIGSCPQNKDFLEDFKEWSQLTSNIFIWDYVVNFGHYIAPYPNFQVLAENIKTFKKYGANVVLELGQRESYGGEFGDMKAWVIAKLLWNPYLDTDALVKEFITDFYGDAAPYIQKYFEMCRNVITPDIHIYQDKYAFDIFSDDFVSQSRSLLDKALAKAKTEEVKARVEDVRAQILYLQTKKYPAKSKLNGDNQAFRIYLQKHKAHVRENLPAEKALNHSGYI